MSAPAKRTVEATPHDGVSTSFATLYETFRRPLYRYCLAFARDTAAAEDATQEAFVRLYGSLESLQGESSVRCWLFTVARNEILGVIRKQRHQVPIGDHDVAEEDTPVTIMMQSESAELVRRMMSELNEEYREVLILREYESFSYAEIAEITSSSLSAVKSRLFHARRALAERLRPWFVERSVQ